MNNILNHKFKVFEDTFLYLQKPFELFDINLLDIQIKENNGFLIFYCYSYDNVSWSVPKQKENFEIEYIPDLENQTINICILFKKINIERTVTSLKDNKPNVLQYVNHLFIDDIIYNDEILESINFKFVSLTKVVNESPRWNFYDNQHNSVLRWKQQCNAISEMYGHIVIYFKTIPTEIDHTFATNVKRSVVSIKKIPLMFINNELPQDRQTYTDWDIMLQDETITHVVIEKFQQAFGLNTFPESKDYLYFPLINKLFRVASSQPKNGYMGAVAWWEVYLQKFEDDESISIDDEIKNAMSGFDILENFEEFKKDTVNTSEKIRELTTNEKKEVTQNFTNKLIDTTTHLDLKETESQREFYDNRLKIVSLNPSKNTFPITMYDASVVEKRVVALTYNLNESVKVNKLSLDVLNSLSLNFNFVSTSKFNGELIELIDKHDSIKITLNQTRKNIQIILHDEQKTIDLEYNFIPKEFYNIEIIYTKNIKQLAIKIYTIINKQKTLDYQNIYVLSKDIIDLNKIFLYGGNYYINDIVLFIDKNKILEDNCNPILQIRKF